MLDASLHVRYTYPSLPTDPEAIIFDLGGVIIDIDPSCSLQAFAELTNKPVEQVARSIEQAGVFEQYESGMVDDHAFFDLLRTTLDTQASSEVLQHAWNTLLGSIPLHKIEAIRKLSEQYRIFLLSNTNKIHFEAVQEILYHSAGLPSFDVLMEGVVLSYEVGMRKPDASIYTYVLDTFSLQPSKTVFIDDNVPNIEAAAALGIAAVHYPVHSGFISLYGHAF